MSVTQACSFSAFVDLASVLKGTSQHCSSLACSFSVFIHFHIPFKGTSYLSGLYP